MQTSTYYGLIGEHFNLRYSSASQWSLTGRCSYIDHCPDYNSNTNTLIVNNALRDVYSKASLCRGYIIN